MVAGISPMWNATWRKKRKTCLCASFTGIRGFACACGVSLPRKNTVRGRGATARSVPVSEVIRDVDTYTKRSEQPMRVPHTTLFFVLVTFWLRLPIVFLLENIEQTAASRFVS